MTDQKILDSGLDFLCKTITSSYKYIGFGNGTWEDSEYIPSSYTALKNEVYRVKVMSSEYSSGVITILAAFTGENIEESGVCKLTEIGLFNTSTESTSQSCLLMKVFSAITMEETDSKVIKITLTLTV